MTQSQRLARLATLEAAVPRILDRAIDRYFTNFADGRGRPRKLAGVITAFSGGNDSLILADIMRRIGRTDYFGHANTGIGIEATREFVRAQSAAWGVPLLEFKPRPGRRYEDYVLAHGFPGPDRHGHIFHRIKGDPFEQMANWLIDNPWNERILIVAGRRFTESERRKRRKIPVMEHKKSIAWVSPLRGWSQFDLNTYRLKYPDTPRNPVADHLDMSGECLCGAYASKGEMERLESYAPAHDVVRQIDDLRHRALAAGVNPERCVWGRSGGNQPCREGCNL